MSQITLEKIGESVLVTFDNGFEILLGETNAAKLGSILLRIANNGRDVLDEPPAWLLPRDPR